VCDAVGADVRTVSRVVGLDPRIGSQFLRPGAGYGGSCFPKDVQALTHTAAHLGVAMPVAQAAQQTNEAQWRRVLARCQALLQDTKDPVVAMWGIAFKPGTDDTRHAPGIRIATALADAGVTVQIHDPIASWPGTQAGIKVCPDPVAAARGAHLLLHVTEWPQYRDTPWRALHDAMARPCVLDARNALPWDDMTAQGFHVEGIGARPAVTKAAEVTP
jgi:UDPglucose 6-dehydrogenase